MIPSTGEKGTYWPKLAINDQYPMSFLGALYKKTEDHIGLPLNIRGQGQHGPKFGTDFRYTKNLGQPSLWNGKGYRVSVVGKEFSSFAKGNSQGVWDALSEAEEETDYSLPTLTKLCKQNPERIFDHFVDYYANCNCQIYAYEKMKSNPTNRTSGIPKNALSKAEKTLDAIDMTWFDNISNQLQKGTYRFQTMKRVSLENPNSQEKCHESISSPRDKIVQRAQYRTLSRVYEPVFLNFSHGFRPNKGCHSALHQIRIQFHHCRWVIESDIQKCFDTIDHDILLKIISKKIHCQKTLKLLESAQKAGYLESIGESVLRNTKGAFSKAEGTPQGSILSPLLCNIYLHEMDIYIQELMTSFCKGLHRKINPLSKKGHQKLQELSPGSKEWKTARTFIRSLPSKDNRDPSVKRIYYVRYADDFLIGIQGSKEDATIIRKSLDDWLQANLKLILHPKKTKICHFRSENTVFLGICIGPQCTGEQPVVRSKHDRKARITPRLPLTLDVKNLYKRQSDRGFVKYNPSLKKYKGIAYSRLQNQEIADIITYFNAVFRGLWNYYSFVDNSSTLNNIWWVLQESLAFTISRKLRLQGIRKVFVKFGYPTSDESGKVKFWKPPTFKRDVSIQRKMRKKNTRSFAELLRTLETSWVNKLSRTNNGKSCIICGSFEKVEIHHVKMLKSLKKDVKKRNKSFFTAQMATIHRKQVPLCQSHHIDQHRGTRSERDRELFKIGCQEERNNHKKKQ